MDRTRDTEAALMRLFEWAQKDNIAEELSDQQLSDLGQRCIREYELDDASRSDWKDAAERALERADMTPKTKSTPFENSSNVQYPLLITASLEFAARAYGALVPGKKIVKPKIQGKDENGEKKARGDRVSEHMSWQLLEQMTDWEEELDIALHQIPIIGCAFRKTYRDPIHGNQSNLVSAMNLVVNIKTKSLDNVPRISHELTLYPHEIEERIDSEVFLEFDGYKTSVTGEDEDEEQDFIEQHRWLDLDDDGHREPWIVTVHRESETVVRIVANFEAEDIQTKMKDSGAIVIARIPRKVRFTKLPFIRDHKGGFYDLGFGTLLEGLGAAINTSINQMLDAGNLQNSGGGLIGSGIRMKKSFIRVQPGKYQTVSAAGGTLRNSIYSWEHPGPSQTLFQLLGMLKEAAERTANIQNILTGDVPANMAATTALAMIEQGMKAYTAIYKRIYRAMSREMKLLAELNSRHLSEEEYFQFGDDERSVAREDYDTKDHDLVPIADPKMVTDAQRLGKAQVILETSQQQTLAPVHDPREVALRVYEAAGIEEVEALVPAPAEDPQAQKAAQEAAALEARGQEASVRKLEADAILSESAASKLDAEQKDADEDRAIELEDKKVERDLKATDLKLKAADLQIKERDLERKEAETGSKADLGQRKADTDDRRADIEAEKVDVERDKARAA